jgi:hypothetical protein
MLLLLFLDLLRRRLLLLPRLLLPRLLLRRWLLPLRVQLRRPALSAPRATVAGPPTRRRLLWLLWLLYLLLWLLVLLLVLLPLLVLRQLMLLCHLLRRLRLRLERWLARRREHEPRLRRETAALAAFAARRRRARRREGRAAAGALAPPAPAEPAPLAAALVRGAGRGEALGRSGVGLSFPGGLVLALRHRQGLVRVQLLQPVDLLAALRCDGALVDGRGVGGGLRLSGRFGRFEFTLLEGRPATHGVRFSGWK